MVFGVFRKVAMGTRFLDRVNDLRPLLTQRPQLSDQLFLAFRQHRQLFDTCHSRLFLLTTPFSD